MKRKYESQDTPHYKGKQAVFVWLSYYKWWALAGIVVLISLVPVLKNALGIGVIKPDYGVALVTSAGVSEETVAELEEALSAFGEDLNGDGAVTVKVTQFRTGAGDAETSLYLGYAGTITVQADIERKDSHVFLMQEPEKFQIAYQILADAEGQLPEDMDFRAEGRFVPFHAERLSLSEKARQELSGLSIGQRGYFQEEKMGDLQARRAFYEKIREAAGK